MRLRACLYSVQNINSFIECITNHHLKGLEGSTLSLERDTEGNVLLLSGVVLYAVITALVQSKHVKAHSHGYVPVADMSAGRLMTICIFLCD